MNMEMITIQDCLDLQEKKDCAVIIENGQVTGFVGNDAD